MSTLAHPATTTFGPLHRLAGLCAIGLGTLIGPAQAYVVQASGHSTFASPGPVDLHADDGVLAAAVSGPGFRAYADLRRGAVGAFAMAGQVDPAGNEFANSTALIEETLSFAGFTGTVDIEIQGFLSGSVLTQGGGGACVNFGVQAGTQRLFHIDSCSYPKPSAVYGELQSARLTLDSAAPTLQLMTSISLYAYGGGPMLPGDTIADFGNTAYLGLVLPAGVSFNSSSGEFLADPFTMPPVPEPQTYALMISGLALLAAVQRRRSAGRVRCPRPPRPLSH